MRKSLSLLLLGLALAGCNGNLVPVNEKALLAPLTPTYTGTLPNPWYLYQAALKTGPWFQGIAVWDNYLMVNINPASAVNPFDGPVCMDVAYTNASSGVTWAEAAFIDTPSFSTYAASTGVNISAGGYTKCVFMLRTDQAATVPFQMDGVPATNIAATTSWQQVTIPLEPVASQIAVKTFFQVNTPTVVPLNIYIADLRYEQ